ncbi:MAG TPA: anthranilate phosphoribosyltransferase [Bacteroides sp.]|nr:anthranilate phosphoribosyltransferase [Bacteroides sp.]
MKEILNFLYEHKTLDRDAAKKVLTNIAKGIYNHSQIASFISVYLMRSITVEELSGFREALLELCIPVDLSDFETVDLCGTGGDGKDTFNISTLTSFVVAGAGVKVAKHGNYGVSSSCGSSNLMEYAGYKFSKDVTKLQTEIDKSGICFLHAPLFNPAMKNVAPVRKELGVKTFFNMLGPMVNPSFPSRQLVGVYSLELARIYAYLYQTTDKQYTIVHSLDGYDEISLTGPCKVITRELDRVYQPAEMGLPVYKAGELSGGKTVDEAMNIFIKVMQNQATNAQLDVVVANGGLVLQTCYPDKDLDECIDMSRESIESGSAFKAFKTLMDLNR